MQQREHKEEAREEHEMVEKTVSPLYDSPHCNKNDHQNPNRSGDVLLWDKYVNVERIGVSRLGFGLGAVGIILMAGAWFSYLHLDGLTPIDTAKKKFGVKNKKKKTKQSMGGDIADYLDEEIVPYEELDESEKAACQMAAFLISGMILVIAGILIPLF